ncbi:MAG TPA: ABC transporter permease [Gemmatimonadales bacterium]|nr:ABC transporter permease [Gemmatimonadales bacterium]
MKARDNEIQEEIAVHLALAIADKMARGASREEAERAARAEFGNVTHVAEVTREAQRGPGLWLERLGQDVRYGWRALRRTPAFTAVAVATLALAIGANSAVFTVVNSVLMQPLPFRDPDALYAVSYLPTNLPFELPPGLDDRLYLEYRQHATRFERITGYQRQELTLSGVGDATRIPGALASSTFFETLGVQPALGRAFTAEEDQAGNDRVVILSDRLWRTRFNSDPRILGTTIVLDGISRTVIGVMPRGFTYPASSQVWTPLALKLDGGNSFLFPVAGRLRAGATPEQARSELAAIARALRPDSRADGARSNAAIIPLKDTVTSHVRTSLLVLAGAVAFVLLIACANVANLLLIRAATRRQEMAVRVALGASRARIARQLLTESVLIALIGGGAGILVAFAGVRALVAMAPAGRLPRIDEVHLNGWVLLFTLTVSLVTGILFGLVPARSGARSAPQEALGQGTRTLGGSHHRLRAAFVTGEIALALILLTGAGLMIKSFLRMRSLDTGYDAPRVVTMSVNLPRIAYPDAARMQSFHTALLERLSRIPGANAVGSVSFRPMSDVGIMGDFVVRGPTPLPHGYTVDKPTVSPGYFAALGIRILAGRDFTTADRAGAPGVVVVSQTVAKRLWPNESAVGNRISMQDHPGPNDWLTVIGVVNDVVQDAQLTRHSTIYLPYLQNTAPFFMNQMTFVVRPAPGAANLAAAMRTALRDVDPAVPAEALQTMDQSLMDTIAEPVFQMRLLATFAFLALLLAVLGTYGVLAYDVTARTREIGLRMALGATPGNVLRMVLGRTAALALLGAAIGVAGSLTLTSVLTKSLFEVKPTDPVTLAAVTIVLMLAALVAGYLPAQRAAGVRALTTLLMHD